jgi:signal transduction histidine kinase
VNILIVDDQHFNLKVAKHYILTFEPESNIIVTTNPFETLEIIDKEEIDIVFLDIMMPEKSGIDVLKDIRDINRYDYIQVIMLTALTDDDNFEKCFNLGANDYLKKPIEVLELKARLKGVFNARESAKKLYEQNKELKEVNAKLKDAQFHIVQKEKLAAIGELAAGVAHEINNPLGYVGSNIETLCIFSEKIKKIILFYREVLEKMRHCKSMTEEKKNEILNEVKNNEKKLKISYIIEEFEEALGDSLQGIERVSKIVQTLKNFARSGMENELTLNNINEVIEEVILIANNEAKYVIDFNKELKIVKDILINRGQISQVILNIIINSIQAIKEQKRDEKGIINIESGNTENGVYLKISDDGPGIPQDYINRVFEPFFTTKEVGQGTGLGLSISHDIIVNKHNGKIAVGNNEEKGAYFYIELINSKSTEA